MYVHFVLTLLISIVMLYSLAWHAIYVGREQEPPEPAQA